MKQIWGPSNRNSGRCQLMTDFCGVMACPARNVSQRSLAKKLWPRPSKSRSVGRSAVGRSRCGAILAKASTLERGIQRRAEALWRHRAPVNSAEERRLTCLRRSIQLAIAGRAREMHSTLYFKEPLEATNKSRRGRRDSPGPRRPPATRAAPLREYGRMPPL